MMVKFVGFIVRVAIYAFAPWAVSAASGHYHVWSYLGGCIAAIVAIGVGQGIKEAAHDRLS